MGTVLITIAVFAIVVLIMSIGVIFSGRCIRGSCGGEEIIGPDGELLNCDSCPVRAEREAREQQLEQERETATRVSLTK